MTPETQTALKIIVERAVRPVQATPTRKKKMREELLAHVTEVFDEELAKSNDETVAVAKTAARFGDPQEVARQLQQSVPRWRRAYMWFDDLMKPVPDDRPVIAALRAARNFAIVIVGTVGFAMGLVIRPTTRSELMVLLSILVLFAIASAGLSFAYVLLGITIRRDCFSATGTHSRLRLATLLAVSLLPVAAIPFLFAAFFGNLSEGVANFKAMTWILPLVPAALYFGTWQYHQECEYAREWKSLQID